MAESESTNLLNARQLQILKLVAMGYIDKEIGDILGLSKNTVKNHFAFIRAILRAHNRAHAVAIAKDEGLL